MPQIVHVNLDPERVPLRTVSADEQARRVTVAANTSEIDLCLLPKGTHEGRSIVSIFARLPDGRPVYVEITARNWMLATRAIAVELASRGEQP